MYEAKIRRSKDHQGTVVRQSGGYKCRTKPWSRHRRHGGTNNGYVKEETGPRKALYIRSGTNTNSQNSI